MQGDGERWIPGVVQAPTPTQEQHRIHDGDTVPAVAPAEAPGL